MRRERLRTTEHGSTRAQWYVHGKTVRILRIERDDVDEPGYRWPNLKLEFAKPGVVIFNEFGVMPPPDIAQAREWFPKLSGLWDKMKEEHWNVLLAQPERVVQ